MEPMYYLFKFDRGTLNGSILGSPLNAVFKSSDLNEIGNEIAKRVADGCPKRNLMVFKAIEMKADINVSLWEE